MKTSFLDYAKIILKKVSFDRWLALKEYLKIRQYLDESEKKELDAWLAKKAQESEPFPIKTIRNKQ